MDRRSYRLVNDWKRLRARVTHPWPIYRRAGGLDVVVTKADGSKVDYGRVADVYAKRWGVDSK